MILSTKFQPNITPFGLIKKKSALGSSKRSKPSIVEAEPPVTRLSTFSIAPGPVKRRTLATKDVERGKTMEEIGAYRLAQRARNCVGSAGLIT